MLVVYSIVGPAANSQESAFEDKDGQIKTVAQYFEERGCDPNCSYAKHLEQEIKVSYFTYCEYWFQES